VVVDWAGFKAAVSYTFDDANSSQIAHYAELRALGVRMTFYLITGKPESSDPVWAAALKDGHEIGNHSKSHAHEGTGPDLDDASAFIHDKLNATAWTMAAPFGDASYRDLATSRFLFNRGVQGGVVRPNDRTDPFVLPCFIPEANAPASAFDAQVEGALRAGGWAIVLVHGFTGGADGAYKAVRMADFVNAVAHARAHDDVWIDSLVNVGAYWSAQKLLTAATPSTAGDTTTWSWTLPPHFPPGKYVRVKVDGGTLSQAGKPLAWDDHGYYEVALDAGALTLRP
jgi:peptidoglycan/xylan/chitin deacetylase (PgdA/CDA1 family)